MRPPLSSASTTFPKPPTTIVDFTIAAIKPASIINVCKVSVHTTAFIPP